MPSLRPARFDDLGLRSAISDRLLPLLVAAMAFLGALALAGLVAASQLAGHWRSGASAMLTVTAPRPSAEPAAALLRGLPGVAAVRLVPDAEMAALLRPWVGEGEAAASLPAVFDVQLGNPGPSAAAIASRLAAVAPGASVEAHEAWLASLSALARSLQACAALAAVIVALVAAAVVAVATRAGLTARRQAIEVVHGLGATDGYIAGRFAGRATALATAGGAIGALAALPPLLGLANLAAPFSAAHAGGGLLAALPGPLWVSLPLLPLSAAAIGWITAQGTVRRWLRRLP